MKQTKKRAINDLRDQRRKSETRKRTVKIMVLWEISIF